MGRGSAGARPADAGDGRARAAQPGRLYISWCQKISIGEQNVSGIKAMNMLITVSDFLTSPPSTFWSNPEIPPSKPQTRWWWDGERSTAPPKMTDLMITMRVAIILIKWDEIWQEEMIFGGGAQVCHLSNAPFDRFLSPPVSFFQYL